jgi:hypothetical protein
MLTWLVAMLKGLTTSVATVQSSVVQVENLDQLALNKLTPVYTGATWPQPAHNWPIRMLKHVYAYMHHLRGKSTYNEC